MPSPVLGRGTGPDPDPITGNGTGPDPDPVGGNGSDPDPDPVVGNGSGPDPDPVAGNGSGPDPDPVVGNGSDPDPVIGNGSGPDPDPVGACDPTGGSDPLQLDTAHLPLLHFTSISNPSRATVPFPEHFLSHLAFPVQGSSGRMVKSQVHFALPSFTFCSGNLIARAGMTMQTTSMTPAAVFMVGECESPMY